ncbi:MAG: hypothetical protein QOK31_895 [Solirubrobacteraceae bacterium]|nr:hypothetical protein [Solirubrobacteraceae bacterium]
MLGGAFALVLFFLVLGRYYPGSGADVLDWKPTRSYEKQVELEIDDLDQMLEARNARRRRRGEPELTTHQVQEQVAEDLRVANARRETYLADQDLEQLVEAKNLRRRKRGLPDVTVADVRAQFEREHGQPQPQPPAAD